MSDKVISCKNISKTFHKEKEESSVSDDWVLKNISFELHKGDALALIGKNGTGKSTLLKILSNIISPTKGQAIIYGTYTSILDIGSGFHPDLSGRENIQLYHSLISPDKKPQTKEIIAFSEMEDYLDMPVKHYSNGMYLRLAFSIAIHAEADLILLDEVLAVGDNSFRNKCYKKIMEKREDGSIFIIASHAMNDILKLCNYGIWINKSHSNDFGKIGDIVSKYIDDLNSSIILQSHFVPKKSHAHHLINVDSIEIFGQKEIKNAIFEFEEQISVKAIIRNNGMVIRLLPILELEDENGAIIAILGSIHENIMMTIKNGISTIAIHFPKMLLNIGVYTINFRILGENNNDVIYYKEALVFKIIQSNKNKNMLLQKNPFGIIAGEATWKIVCE